MIFTVQQTPAYYNPVFGLNVALDVLCSNRSATQKAFNVIFVANEFYMKEAADYMRGFEDRRDCTIVYSPIALKKEDGYKDMFDAICAFLSQPRQTAQADYCEDIFVLPTYLPLPGQKLHEMDRTAQKALACLYQTIMETPFTTHVVFLTTTTEDPTADQFLMMCCEDGASILLTETEDIVNDGKMGLVRYLMMPREDKMCIDDWAALLHGQRVYEKDGQLSWNPAGFMSAGRCIGASEAE